MTMPLADAAPYLRFAAGLVRHLRQPLARERAGEGVSRRLAGRRQALAELLERRVWRAARSPYRRLLEAAGWEPAKLGRHLEQVGVERALSDLAESGVYVSLEEFKGRRPIVRGSTTIAVTEDDFDNPDLTSRLDVKSGGTRSAGTHVPVTLEFATALAEDTAVLFDEWRLWDHAQAIWLPMGGSAFVALLIYAKLGRTPVKWFSHLRPREQEWSERVAPWLLALLGAAARVRVARPEFAPAAAAPEIARWMAAMVREGRPPCLTTYASSAVRVGSAAVQAGLDLSGAAFVTIGEPMTGAKRRAIEPTGARVIVRYAMTEAGIIGYACGRPAAEDDLHALESDLAVIRRDVAVGDDGPTVGGLLFTSLLPSAPKILLNVQSGDYATLERRECGCALGRAGYGTHLSGVRSFEKLTGEGVTFATSNLLSVLEDVLPARFGGQPTDYQVVEREGSDGLPQLLLLVHPGLGPIDDAALKNTFLEHLATDKAGRRFSLIWRQADIVDVRRAPPVATKKGKVLPFHLGPV
jgi:hypothetical protein